MAIAALEPVALDNLDSSIASPLRAASDRLGYFGEMFQYLANGPAALSAFLDYSGALRTTLDPRLSELIALTVCTRMDFSYERIQHERLSAALGYSLDWIAALAGKGQSDMLSDGERAARDLTLCLVEGRHDDARSAFPRVSEAYDVAQAVALLFQATRLMGVCTIGLVLDAKLPVASLFADDDAARPAGE